MSLSETSEIAVLPVETVHRSGHLEKTLNPGVVPRRRKTRLL